jgi:PKD repeat protein
MKHYLSRFGLLVGLGSLWLVGCGDWTLPDPKTQRRCITPTAAFTNESNLLQVQFRVSQQSGTVDAVSWNFGDNTAPTSLTAVAHTYERPGTYKVELTLTNTCGERVPVSREITVTNIVPPTVVTQEVVAAGYTNANLKVAVTNTGNAPITRYGLCWSATNPMPTLADSTVDGILNNLTLNTPVAVAVPRLKTNTFYYVRAFALNAGNTPGYGLPLTVQTGRFPAFSIPEAVVCGSSCFSTARVLLRVSDPGSPAITQYGFVYSFTTDRPDLTNATTVDVNNPAVGSNVPVTLTGLQAGRRYWIRPFARTAAGPQYGASVAYETQSNLTRDLVLYLPFSENGNPSLNDQSGNNNNASPVGNPIFTTTNVRGTNNTAIKLDGINDYFLIPDRASLQPDTAFSISLRFRLDALTKTMQVYNKSNFADASGEQYSSLIRPVNAAANQALFTVDVKQNSGCKPGVGWQTFLTTTEELRVGTWYHLVFVYKGQQLQAYLDRKLIWQIPNLLPGGIDRCPGGALKFGAQTEAFPNFFNGAMDDIRVYRRALTPDDVAELYAL